MTPEKPAGEAEEGPVQLRRFDLTLWRECRAEAKRRKVEFRGFVEQALREHMRKKQ